MNRLWVHLSLMLAGVLLFVFFLQFASIMLEDEGRAVAGDQHPAEIAGPPREEIARRLIDFAALSIVVGTLGGVVIGRVVSRPIGDLVKAARQIGAGDRAVRAPLRGSREMKELAASFNTMAADLQRAEMLRNNLMADVSHELRSPLTALEGNLRAVLDHVYTLDEAEIANLYGQTRHLIRIVNDLRELSLAENHQLRLEKQPTDVTALIAETVQAIEPLAIDKGVQLIERVAALPEISIDPVRIRQVLFNLLANSLRHTPTGGTITVSGIHSDKEVCLSVQDTGEGLNAEQLASAFDRFYRGDKSRSRESGGTGLGLAIVKAIVEAHGGRVTAQSEGHGGGSTFSVYLPRSTGAGTGRKEFISNSALADAF
jgi:signal transduction histidine kinase